jgi:2-hydroxychromene-2-carboxylate isomerase
MPKLKMKTVNFYYSIGSRYSYLASTQIDALKQATGCYVEWHPVNSVRLISQLGSSPFAGNPVSTQYEWTYRELDAKRWANLYGVPYIEPHGRVDFDSDLLAQACTAAKCLGKVEEYSRLLFAAMFQEPLAKIDEQECTLCAEAVGIIAVDFQTALRSPAIAAQLTATIDTAIQAGVFGVPTFIVDGEIFWGNDRLVLLRHYLELHRF